MIISFNVEKQIVTRTDRERVVRLSRNYLYAHFEFSEEWIGEKTAVFKYRNKAYNMLLDSEGTCLVPWEILKCEYFDVSVFCGNLITANVARVFTIASGYALGENSKVPTPNIYTQIIEKIDGIVAETIPYDNTQSGMGAENVQEALDELAAGGGGGGGVTPNISMTATVDATTGTPDVEVTKTGTLNNPVFNLAFSGLKGEKGETGAQGEKGEKGDIGAQGAKGDKGEQGIQGVKGDKGDTGAKGEKGDTGAKGDKGDTGEQGIQGVKGDPGTTPIISASATVTNTTGTPTVNVTKTGTDEAPSFAFNFSGIKGEDAEEIQHTELPTPSASIVDKVVQYIGDGSPSKTVITVIDDGGNKSSTTTGILSYLQNKNIPLNIGVNTYQIGTNNKYYNLEELHTLETQGTEIIMRSGTDSTFNTDASTVEAFTQDAEAVKAYAEANGFKNNLRIYPQGIRVYGGTNVDEKIGVLDSLGVNMAFNLECNVEMYDTSQSHPEYAEWYNYANGHDAGLGIANVVPFVTMPNGYSKSLMLNRAEMTHAKLTDAQRVADINTMIQQHRYVVLFGHSYQSEWTTAGEDGKTTTELFEAFIDDLVDTYGDEILWLTPTQAWNYFNSLPKTGHFYQCVLEDGAYTWKEIQYGNDVTVTPTLQSGTKIAEIDIDGDKTGIFAPTPSEDSVIHITTAVTEYTIATNALYIFDTELVELDVTLQGEAAKDHHFIFTSGSTPTEIYFPQEVIFPDNFSIEANKVYEISVLNNLLLYQSWAKPEEEED